MASQSSESKLGFWTLISIVISAELGASIFLLPSQLAHFRTLGLIGWGLAGIGAILIAIVFAYLCINTSKVGGPHIYARMFFGEKVGFFVTWIYWCGAWACNPILIATAVNYLMALTGDLPLATKLACEISLVLSLTFLNTKGVKTSGNVEMVLTVLKVLPLVIVPIVAFNHINLDNFKEMTPINLTPMKTIIGATILSFWSFVGLEGGTNPAGVTKNPRRNIPLAIIVGTSFVAIISIINTISIFGITPPSELENIGAPFSHVMVTLFGGSFDKLIGVLTFLMCYGSLNAWVLFSGQIARSAASEGMMPKFFNRLNKNGAPANALWLSSLGTILILFILKSPLIGDKIVKLLDMSIVVYVTLYTMAILAYIKFMRTNKIKSLSQMFVTILALAFCSLILFNTEKSHFIFLIGMIATGIPAYLYLRKGKAS